MLICKRAKFLLLAAAFLLLVLPGCEKFNKEPPGQRLEAAPFFTSFRDVPGVTIDEIRSIEAVQNKVDYFIYGMVVSTEAFLDENGNVQGYASLLCDWLSEFFGIPFQPKIYDWLDLLDGLKTGEISFSGELTATRERLNIYHMTSDIATRPIKYFRLFNCKPFSEIIEDHPIRCGFIEGTNTINTVVPELNPGTFEIVFLEDVSLVHDALKSGKIDAFYYTGTAEANFIEYGDMVAMDFYPLIYRPVSLTTQDPALEPFISVVEKVLENGGIRHFINLYNQGEQDYLRSKLLVQLTEEERSYIKTNPVVPIGVDPGNYPGSFYDRHENEWRGIFFDILQEVSNLTGLSFMRVNNEFAKWPEIYQMLVHGDAALVAELTQSDGNENLFLWPETAQTTDYYALISRSSYPDIKINEVLYASVGLAKNSSHAAVFKKWFPNHMNTVEFENMEEAFDALHQGKIDMVMTNQTRLLYLTHYLEFPDYKVNVVFNQSIDIKMGFNKDEVILCSIFNKALRMIDTKGISDHWARRTYDYRSKLAEAQRPWFIRMSILSLIVLALMTAFLIRSHNIEKKMENIVRQRTGELEMETSKLQAIFNSIPDILFCKDLNSRYTQYNKVLADYFEIDEQELIGKDDVESGLLPVELIGNLKEFDKIIMNNNCMQSFEEWIPSKKKGINRLFEIIVAPLTKKDAVVGLIGIARDVTQRKAMEEEALSASRAKTAFLANMSHEMRTPMNVVVGLTELMLEGNDSAVNFKDNLKKISTAGNTLLELINDVLDISKIEAGKIELTPTQYDLASILNDVITLNILRIEDKPIEFQLDVDKTLPASLYGDDLRVKQIINNILGNSFKYTREGTVKLRVSCTSENSQTMLLSICISDTGIGIREEDLKKLFTDYHQVDTNANRYIEGTGLGLSITKKLVELMDGKITVESEYGKGTTFCLFVKQGFVSNNTIGEENAKNLRSFNYTGKRKMAHEKLVRADLSYARVLVVDDMQPNLDVASGLLKKYKMKVDCVKSGQEAINRIESGEIVYNAIFMDHMMPGMDGIETVDRIRALGTEYSKKIPIIALTANAVQGAKELFLAHDFQDFLSKPIHVMQLDSIVQKWVRNKQMEKMN